MAIEQNKVLDEFERAEIEHEELIGKLQAVVEKYSDKSFGEIDLTLDKTLPLGCIVLCMNFLPEGHSLFEGCLASEVEEQLEYAVQRGFLLGLLASKELKQSEPAAVATEIAS